MSPEERLGAGELAGEGYAGVVDVVRDTHRAIAERVFGAVGLVAPAAQPVEVAHDAIASVAYSTTRALGSSLLRSVGVGSAVVASPGGTTIDRRPLGRIARGALGALAGDRLEAHGNALAIAMAVRVAGQDVALDARSVAAAFHYAGPRIAVFLHGLGETEDAWLLRSGSCGPGAEALDPGGRVPGGPGSRGPLYGERLAAELGITPVYVRFNSGLHVSENGRRLARLLDEVCAAWPVELSSIALIGHSMGGLVARSACHYGADSGWIARTRTIVTLAAPHTGAPLERGAHALGWALSRLPETRPLARPLAQRSAGIRDLGHGYITDECWRGQEDGGLARFPARRLPFAATATHYFVSASITTDPEHPLGRRLGDLLVLRDSAWGRSCSSERVRFPADRYRHIGGIHHFDLLGHPVVADLLVGWLSQSSERRELAAGRGELGAGRGELAAGRGELGAGPEVQRP